MQAPAFAGRQAHELDLIGLGDGADHFRYGGEDLRACFVGVVDLLLWDHLGVDALALDVVRKAHHGAFHDPFTFVDGVLDLGRAETVTAHVDHIVHTTDDVVVAFAVAACAMPSVVSTKAALVS